MKTDNKRNKSWLRGHHRFWDDTIWIYFMISGKLAPFTFYQLLQRRLPFDSDPLKSSLPKSWILRNCLFSECLRCNCGTSTMTGVIISFGSRFCACFLPPNRCLNNWVPLRLFVHISIPSTADDMTRPNINNRKPPWHSITETVWWEALRSKPSHSLGGRTHLRIHLFRSPESTIRAMLKSLE